MARKARPHPKPQRQPTFIREWRKHSGLSLERLSERLELEFDIDCSLSQLSRIERGQQPYSQDLLEALAGIFKTDAASLIIRRPEGDAIWSIWEGLTQPEKTQAMAVIKALKTGT